MDIPEESSGIFQHLVGQGHGGGSEERSRFFPALQEEGQELPFALDVDGAAPDKAESVLLQDLLRLLHHLPGKIRNLGILPQCGMWGKEGRARRNGWVAAADGKFPERRKIPGRAGKRWGGIVRESLDPWECPRKSWRNLG